MKKKFVIGDIHGNYKGLLQCLQRSGFDYENDELIALGDICDGLTQTKECFDELLKIKHLILIVGNHDYWFLEWASQEGHPGRIWTDQGGRNTQLSYGDSPLNVPESHIKLIEGSSFGMVDEETNSLFVHGGIDPNKPFEGQDSNILMWDRDLVRVARLKHNQKPDYKYGDYNEIFVGHTSTTYFAKTTEPKQFCNVWMLDTGGGWDGKLTIMNRETKEYWQSDLTPDLYPGVMPRYALIG